MNKLDLCYTPAIELASLIANKSISAVEVMKIFLERTENLNPILNSICTFTPDYAMEQAQKADDLVLKGEPLGPLHGVPVTIKDLVFTKGIRTMEGSVIFKNRIPNFDSVVVNRLNEAGSIILGKTTTPEFGWKGCGDSPLTGVSHNPWNLGMNAGGSSTGAAICAASGIAPINLGSDGGGSIRIPASFCGVYGFKPSFGRIPFYPQANNDFISHHGPITRTVTDGAYMLMAMIGPDDRDPTSLFYDQEDYLKKLDNGISELKVAWSPDLGYLKVDTEVAQKVESSVKSFQETGCNIEEINLSWEDPKEMELFFWSTNFCGNINQYLINWGDQMDPGLVECARDGLNYSAVDYVKMKQRRLDYYNTVQSLFQEYDLLLTPTLSVAAFPNNRLIPEHWEQHNWDWFRWAGFCYPFNLTWLPAATCPCGFNEKGLPIGLQIIGGPHQDLKVLQASLAFEKICPWSNIRPIL